MSAKKGLFSADRVRRFFTDANTQALERRVLNLPVAVERRGAACTACGFGTMHLIPDGLENAGRLRCNRVGCAAVCDPPVRTVDFAMQPGFART